MGEGKWSEAFETFRDERARMNASAREFAMQKSAMRQEDEVASRLYAEMELMSASDGEGEMTNEENEGKGSDGGTRRARWRANEEMASDGARRAAKERATRERAKMADANPFANVGRTTERENAEGGDERREFGMGSDGTATRRGGGGATRRDV